MFKYGFEERERWIKSFLPNYDKQKWHSNKVYHPSEIRHLKFFKLHKNYTAFINPKDIKGIEYSYAYNCPTSNNNVDWKYMLHWLKRLDSVIDDFNNKGSLIKHIHNDTDRKVVLKYGGNYFTISGQHRLCIAKYLEIEKVEVFVQEFKLDKDLFIREKTIEKFYHKLIDLKLVTKDEYQPNLNSDVIGLNISDDIVFLHKKLI